MQGNGDLQSGSDGSAQQERYNKFLRRMISNLPKDNALSVVKKHYSERHSGEELSDAEALAKYLAYFDLTPETLPA